MDDLRSWVPGFFQSPERHEKALALTAPHPSLNSLAIRACSLSLPEGRNGPINPPVYCVAGTGREWMLTCRKPV